MLIEVIGAASMTGGNVECGQTRSLSAGAHLVAPSSGTVTAQVPALILSFSRTQNHHPVRWHTETKTKAPCTCPRSAATAYPSSAPPAPPANTEVAAPVPLLGRACPALLVTAPSSPPICTIPLPPVASFPFLSFSPRPSQLPSSPPLFSPWPALHLRSLSCCACYV